MPLGCWPYYSNTFVGRISKDISTLQRASHHHSSHHVQRTSFQWVRLEKELYLKCWGQELDSMILMGSFHLGYSMILWFLTWMLLICLHIFLFLSADVNCIWQSCDRVKQNANPPANKTLFPYWLKYSPRVRTWSSRAQTVQLTSHLNKSHMANGV